MFNKRNHEIIFNAAKEQYTLQPIACLSKKLNGCFDSSPFEHTKNAEEVLKFLAKPNTSIFSVIFYRDHLADSHWEDPNYNKLTYKICGSEVMECLWSDKGMHPPFDDLVNIFRDDSTAEKYQKMMEWKTRPDNETTEEDRTFLYEIFDKAIESSYNFGLKPAYDRMLKTDLYYRIDELVAAGELKEKYLSEDYGYFNIEDNLNPKWVRWNKLGSWETKEYKRVKALLQKEMEKVEQEGVKHLLPRTLTTAQRVYDIPEPFDHWDSRNYWQQFFLLKDDDAKTLQYVHGGGGSSWQREMQGLWAATFMTLHKEHGVLIPTNIYLYNKDNVLSIREEHPDLQLVAYELSGNYQLEWDEKYRLYGKDTPDPCLVYPYDWKEEDKQWEPLI